ncbi:ABC transporter ATP-binding protein [Rubrimonas cliftonensis]|uniref:Putative spermidine/putrescine transport system ATP-binding protein n=1 Tax=Rubrimonas cliftonensis TaxID=89524 RepID=A0A1H4AHM3_9RHOB|nr:ABC transporter ATP-binding protein [Rubrimonas cliftonensis]SEA35251.1 putative spermidine/putrescine transport system ATP-binding protein [Rubrimonas cliftonensis]
MGALSLSGVSKSWGAVTAVSDLSLDFPEGQLTALLGPSGCGKTTLLRMIAGLEAPSRGRVLLDGADITDRPAHVRRFGMVFQSFALFPHLSVAENVAYALAIAGMARRDRLAKAEALLALVQLDGYGDRRIGQLSGGQRQRVAIARALAQEPSVFLLDEPMSALDAKLREEMQVELRLLQQKLRVTTIVVTHDQREAMTMADRIVVMNRGEIEQVGPPQEVYDRPATAFVAGFIGKANILHGEARGGAVAAHGALFHPERPAAFRDGSPVTLACRPEAVRLGRAAREGANQLAARVSFVRDVGPTREIFLDAGPATLTAELGAGEREPFSVGEPVFAELPPAALRLFPRAA